MKTYEVELRGTMELEASVRVEAPNACEAEILAKKQVDDGQVNWDPVGGMTAKTQASVLGVREVNS